MKKPADPEVRLLQALADPARLAIVRQLRGATEICACDFTGCCGGQRRGTWVWYSLDPDGLAHLTTLLSDLAPEPSG